MSSWAASPPDFTSWEMLNPVMRCVAFDVKMLRYIVRGTMHCSDKVLRAKSFVLGHALLSLHEVGGDHARMHRSSFSSMITHNKNICTQGLKS